MTVIFFGVVLLLVGLEKKHRTIMQKMYITTAFVINGLHYIFKTCT